MKISKDMNPTTMKLQYFSESGIEIFHASAGAAGLDLPLWDDRMVNGEWSDNGEITLQPMEQKTIKTGVYMAIPEGYYGQLDTRSSTSKIRLDLLCHTIDSDYRGNIRLALINLNTEPVTLKNGQSIAQIIIKKHETVETEKVSSPDALPATVRGGGGFGSTGRNV
jgi:dUTP pyrophosphatase